MKHTKTTAALVLGLLSLTLLAGCGRGSPLRMTPGGIAAGIVGEAIYDGLKSAAEQERAARAAWKAGVTHPQNRNLLSTERYSFWRPINGATWTNSGTTEPRWVR